MPDVQELKEATELRSRLGTVSEAGGQSFTGARDGESGPEDRTA